MKKPDQATSYRLPHGTRERINALKQPGESSASVIVRAIDALEIAPQPLTQAERIAALEGRMEHLIGIVSAGHTAPIPAGPAREKAPKFSYPLEVRQRAVAMQIEGRTMAEIADEIRAACGRAPDRSNLGRALSSWEDSLRGQ